MFYLYLDTAETYLIASIIKMPKENESPCIEALPLLKTSGAEYIPAKLVPFLTSMVLANEAPKKPTLLVLVVIVPFDNWNKSTLLGLHQGRGIILENINKNRS